MSNNQGLIDIVHHYLKVLMDMQDKISLRYERKELAASIPSL